MWLSMSTSPPTRRLGGNTHKGGKWVPRHLRQRRRRVRPLRLVLTLVVFAVLAMVLLRPTLPTANAASLDPTLPKEVQAVLPKSVRPLLAGGHALVVSLGTGKEPQSALIDASIKGRAPRVYPLALTWNGSTLASAQIGKSLDESPGAADYGLGASGGFAYFATAVSGQFQTVTVAKGGTAHWLFALSAPAQEVRLTPSGTRIWVAYLVHGNWRQGVIQLSQVAPRSSSAALVAVASGVANHNSLFIRIVEGVRQYFGNGIVAAIEDGYYNLADTVQRIYYRATGQRASTPTLAAARHVSVKADHLSSLLPQNIALPQNWPKAAGEGVWQPVGPLVGGHPAMEETFLHPDPQRPWATSYLVWIDPSALQVHYQTGLSEPVSASGIQGSGMLPTDPTVASHVVAAFNAGFKSESTTFGAMMNGEVLDPPVPGVATFAIYQNGHVALGAWGSRSVPQKGLASFRQNLPLIVDHSKLSPLLGDPQAWGVVVGNSTYVWRSGLGITSAGDLVYTAGNPLSAYTLADTLVAAGAVRAMQLDINSYWVTFNFYQWVQQGASGYLVGTKLTPAIERPANRYLTPDSRDFFYLTTP